MSIPNYQALMAPVLEFYKDGAEHELQEAVRHIADQLRLTPDERALTTSSGQPIINGRVGWAHTYLRQAGLIENVRRAVCVITPRGRAALDSGEPIDNAYLNRYPEFIEFKSRKYRAGNEPASIEVDNREDATPSERISLALNELHQALAEDLLDALRASDPFYFEKIVAELLRVMGYGEVVVTQRTNDGGVDAIVNEDALGLSKIYVQAKRYAADNRVNRKELRDFVGALELSGVSKGVFIATSTFHKEALNDLRSTPKSIVLVNGEELTALMIKYNVGVYVEKTHELKKLQYDFFDDES